MRTVESKKYRVPEGNVFPNIKPHNLNNLLKIADVLGFARYCPSISTEKSQWWVFERPAHKVPNFPRGSTRICSSLAVYGIGLEKSTYAILRISPETHSAEEFENDLKVFTGLFIEIPLLTRIIPSGILRGLSEGYARRQISHPEQYIAGEEVILTLKEELDHKVTVAIQRELYQALQQEGEEDLTPNKFLGKIYGQMPQIFIARRLSEVKQAIYPGLSPKNKTGRNSLPDLVRESKNLLST